MIDPETLFKVLADETRLRCLLLLAGEGELCVCELGHALGEAQPKISRHLATLRKTEVVQDRREGQWVHYRLHPALPEWVGRVLAGAASGAEGREPFRADCQRLREMADRPARCAGVGCC